MKASLFLVAVMSICACGGRLTPEAGPDKPCEFVDQSVPYCVTGCNEVECYAAEVYKSDGGTVVCKWPNRQVEDLCFDIWAFFVPDSATDGCLRIDNTLSTSAEIPCG